jgi:hypothetical protein
MMQPLFPLVSWHRIENRDANQHLSEWFHFLGPCNRPFGKQSFGLYLQERLVALAVSATPVAPTCAGFDRRTVVELARLCAHPEHRDMTRVALRLWRVTAAAEWTRDYWPVIAYVSYARKDRHTGDVYRFDGWEKAKDARASIVTAGSHHSTPGPIHAKTVWVWRLPTC